MSKNIQLVGKTFTLVKHSIHRPKSREHSSALCPWEITLRVLAALAKKLELQIRGVTICYIQDSHNLLGYQGRSIQNRGQKHFSHSKKSAMAGISKNLTGLLETRILTNLLNQ
jgi:hypothetical protein